jgi:hypothetical protein
LHANRQLVRSLTPNGIRFGMTGAKMASVA